MKVVIGWLMGFALVLFLSWTSYESLSRVPLGVFWVEKSSEGVDAFQVDLFLSGARGQMTPISLTNAQKKLLQDAFDQKNISAVELLGQEVDGGKLLVGVSGSSGDWPWFIGGGIKSLWGGDNNVVFDNLTALDRIYLCLATQPPAGLSIGGVPAAQTTNAPVLNPTPVPVSAQNNGAVVRVKILNGCGITNAADWVAGRLKGPGIIISEVTNADQFHYPKTLVQSSIGVPVALAEALERLGVSQEDVESAGASEADADVVVTVGKDYLNLRGKARERSHNGKK